MVDVDWREVALALDVNAKELERFEGTSYKAAGLVLKCLAGALGVGILVAANKRPPTKDGLKL